MPLQPPGILYSNFQREYKTLVRGEGAYVIDEEGRRYLDAGSAAGVVNIGYGVEEIIEAMANQARVLSFSYAGLADNRPRQALGLRLQAWAPEGMGETRSLLCSGGAEATESALKLAYQYHWERGNPSKRKLIGRWQSYHGNTIGALSVSGRTAWRRVHDPYLLGFPHIPPPYCYRCPWSLPYPECGIQCAQELRTVICQEGPENVAAFIAEPIIGTSMSAVVPPPEYYPIVRRICDEYDVLLIVDEVMTGIGRTGKRWGIEHWATSPDMLTTAKGLSGGYSPMGAVVLGDSVWQTIARGGGRVMHSYTFGGNPIGCAAAVAVLDYVEKYDLVARASELGDRLREALEHLLGAHPHVGDIRGKGLLAGLELVSDRATKQPFPAGLGLTARVEEHAHKRGLIVLAGVPGLIEGAMGDHIELAPPFIVETEQVEEIAAILYDSIEGAVSELP
jgi:adenosylmethionine-8-amino-7-oxononanoate aminotransferase